MLPLPVSSRHPSQSSTPGSRCFLISSLRPNLSAWTIKAELINPQPFNYRSNRSTYRSTNCVAGLVSECCFEWEQPISPTVGASFAAQRCGHTRRCPCTCFNSSMHSNDKSVCMGTPPRSTLSCLPGYQADCTIQASLHQKSKTRKCDAQWASNSTALLLRSKEYGIRLCRMVSQNVAAQKNPLLKTDSLKPWVLHIVGIGWCLHSHAAKRHVCQDVSTLPMLLVQLHRVERSSYNV